MRELKIEAIVVVDDDFDDDSDCYLDHQLHDALGNGKMGGIVGVAAARVVDIKPLKEGEDYDEYPLYDGGAVWCEHEKSIQIQGEKQ